MAYPNCIMNVMSINIFFLVEYGIIIGVYCVVNMNLIVISSMMYARELPLS